MSEFITDLINTNTDALRAQVARIAELEAELARVHARHARELDDTVAGYEVRIAEARDCREKLEAELAKQKAYSKEYITETDELVDNLINDKQLLQDALATAKADTALLEVRQPALLSDEKILDWLDIDRLEDVRGVCINEELSVREAAFYLMEMSE